MRQLCLVLCLLVGCGGRQKPTDPAELRVEEVAMWFVRAALAGDEATATSLSLQSYLAAGISKKAAEEGEQWDARIKSVIAQLGQEGDGEVEVTSAQVVERRTLDPRRDEKVLRKTEVAIVKVNVRERDGGEHASPMPWLFVKTEQGWKFSPK